MKLLIADDHTLFRDTLVQYIQRAETAAKVSVGKTLNEADDILHEDSNYDLVLLDFRMPGMNGLEGFQKIREKYPFVKTALMSGLAEPDDVKAAMDMGSVGYFPKTLSGKSLLSAIQRVMAGEKFVPIDQHSNAVMPSYYGGIKRIDFTFNESRANQDIRASKLTPREREVLVLLSQGASNKDIAQALGLQVVTIKLHVRGVCQKLNAQSRTQAAMKALEWGLISRVSRG